MASLRLLSHQFEENQKFFEDLRKSSDEFVAQGLGIRLHPYLNPRTLLEPLYQALDTLSASLDEELYAHPNYLKDDPILDHISSLFANKIGAAYTDEVLKELHGRGKQRYESKIPPGYADQADKKGTEQYGDYLIWEQMIDQANSSHKTIIFITNDSKEDWWWVVKGRTVGPRPELVEEILARAGSKLLMYTSDRFLEYARGYLDVQVKASTVDEIREFKEADAELDAQVEQLAARLMIDPMLVDEYQRDVYLRRMQEHERLLRLSGPANMDERSRDLYFRNMQEQERLLRLSDPANMDERSRDLYFRNMQEQERLLRLNDPAYVDEQRRMLLLRSMQDRERLLRLNDPAHVDEQRNRLLLRSMQDRERFLRSIDPTLLNASSRDSFNRFLNERIHNVNPGQTVETEHQRLVDSAAMAMDDSAADFDNPNELEVNDK